MNMEELAEDFIETVADNALATIELRLALAGVYLTGRDREAVELGIAGGINSTLTMLEKSGLLA